MIDIHTARAFFAASSVVLLIVIIFALRRSRRLRKELMQAKTTALGISRSSTH